MLPRLSSSEMAFVVMVLLHLLGLPKYRLVVAAVVAQWKKNERWQVWQWVVDVYIRCMPSLYMRNK